MQDLMSKNNNNKKHVSINEDYNNYSPPSQISNNQPPYKKRRDDYDEGTFLITQAAKHQPLAQNQIASTRIVRDEPEVIEARR
jgi:hypothetical protein